MVQLPEVRQLLSNVVRSLVEDEDAVFVDQIENESSVLFRLIVAPYDLPKVSGVRGRNANALRWILRAMTSADVRLEIVKSQR